MHKSKSTTIMVFTITAIVIVIGFFLLNIEKNAINLWAFGSLLFSLVVSLLAILTLSSLKRDNNNVFYTAGLTSLVSIYQIMVVISILFTNYFSEQLNGFILLQLIINALFIIIALTIANVSRHIHKNNAKTQESLDNNEYDQPKRGGL